MVSKAPAVAGLEGPAPVEALREAPAGLVGVGDEGERSQWTPAARGPEGAVSVAVVMST